MIRLFLLLPLITFGLWYLYLRHNGWTIEQGMKGFKVILAFNVLMLGFFAFLLVVTQ